MNLINNKKKDVKQFLEEMKANKTNRSSNQNSLHSQKRNSPIIVQHEDNFNSNGISKRISYDMMQSRKFNNFDSIRGVNSTNSSNGNIRSYSQRNSLSPTEFNLKGKTQQAPYQMRLPSQHNLYDYQKQSFCHPYQNPIQLTYQNIRAPMSQNLHRTYSSEQIDHFVQPQQYFQKQRSYQNINHYGSFSQNQVPMQNSARNLSFYPNQGYNQNQKSEKINNYYHEDEQKSFVKMPKEFQPKGPFNTQKIQNPQNFYEKSMIFKAQNNLSQVSHNLRMQEITQVSIGNSSSNKTPGKISDISSVVNLKQKNQTPVSKLLRKSVIKPSEINKIKNNFVQRQQQEQNKFAKNKANQAVKVQKNFVQEKDKVILSKIMSDQQKVSKALGNILSDLNILYKNLQRNKRQFEDNMKEGGKINRAIKRNKFSWKNSLEKEKVQLQKYEFQGKQLSQIQSDFQI